MTYGQTAGRGATTQGYPYCRGLCQLDEPEEDIRRGMRELDTHRLCTWAAGLHIKRLALVASRQHQPGGKRKEFSGLCPLLHRNSVVQ